jgi:16S rRNA (cytosine967-C5)-methyltransferase
MTARKKTGATRTAQKTHPAEISSARKASFQILMAIERGQSHSDDLLRGKTVNALSAPDRNLATALVLGVLRWQIQLDRQIRALLTRPNAKLDSEICIALRLGAFQLQHLDRIPARAAIDESVELARQSGHHFASGMVNAVLRKLAKAQQPKGVDRALKGHDFSRAAKATNTTRALAPEGCFPPISPGESMHPLQAAEKLDPKEDIETKEGVETEGGGGFNPRIKPTKSARALAPEKSYSEEMEAHPAWLVERWTNFYGLDAARAICIHGQSQPALTLRLASPADEDELRVACIVLEPGELLTAARTVVAGDVTSTEAVRAGRVRLQDEGSQLVAELAVCAASLNQNDNKILDACAAPGGKTLILAERNPNAHIVAMESSALRLEQLQKRLAPHASHIECRLADATALTEDSAFDLVLADVPCSGTGTLGRNPEIRHRLRPEYLTRQAERQRAILAAALRALRPGGFVVYSTCSLEPEENEQVVAAVLAATPNARAVSLETRIEALLDAGVLTNQGAERLRACLTSEGALRLLPGRFHTDGFFICMIERTA